MANKLPILTAFLSLAACATEPPGFDTPESALHDPTADVYLVSNLNGTPLQKDNNGYISRVPPEGSSAVRHWIQGGRDGVTLHAPKGMALVGDVLWVSDIDVLRKFDRTSGKALGEVAIPGATFLNDVSAGPDGSVFCSDTGLDANFGPTGTDAIWRVKPDGTVEALAKTPDLGQPNGIVARDQGVYVVNWRDGAFFEIDLRGVRTDLGKAPKAQLDGLVRVDAGDGKPFWLMSSWAGQCVYRFDLNGQCTPLAGVLEQPADIGYDGKRGRLLVPLFGQNRLVVRAP